MDELMSFIDTCAPKDCELFQNMNVYLLKIVFTLRRLIERLVDG